MFGKKEAYNAITSAVFIQIFILLSYILAVNLGSQAIIPDLSTSVNAVFKLEEVSIMASLIGFMVSNYILIYLYDCFRLIGKKLIGLILGVIISLIVYGLIYISINYYSYGVELILNLIVGHITMSLIMTILIIILFYILKDKENIHVQNNVFIQDINIKINNDKKVEDKTVLDVINLKDKPEKKSKKDSSNKNTTKKRNSTSKSSGIKQKNDNKSKKEPKK